MFTQLRHGFTDTELRQIAQGDLGKRAAVLTVSMGTKRRKQPRRGGRGCSSYCWSVEAEAFLFFVLFVLFLGC